MFPFRDRAKMICKKNVCSAALGGIKSLSPHKINILIYNRLYVKLSNLAPCIPLLFRALNKYYYTDLQLR